ncbi:MAG: DUF3667 domain-containing protein [Hyphomonadaceae bacterium]|nr:DUF3667 domain-containing protein [Hyphomonadaceae bacterium]
MSSDLPACKNCGAVLEDTYCGDCGQRGKEVRRPVIGLVQDVLIDTLALDGKLFRSIRLLVIWPGRLARHYLDGKRASHTAPFRMYLFTSLFFFLAFFSVISSEFNDWNPDENGDFLGNAENVEDIEDFQDELPPGVHIERTEEDPDDDPADSVSGDGENEGADFNTGIAALDAIGPRMEEAVERIREDPRLFVAQVKDNVPRILLLAPLVYGLLLAIVYIYRRKFYFYDHLVVSLYMHSALYAYLLITLILSYIPGGGWVAWIPLTWGSLQPFAVLKQAYGSPWYSVVLKGTMTNMIYLIVLLMLILFGLGYSVYLS